ncbi:MAG: biotin--[acetyl-CoA-carboxylase] ligase [Ferruginibacter sp.]
MPDSVVFNELASVDSTNNYAMGKVHAAMAKHGEAWFAYEQTAGKGQRGRNWLGSPGENIAMSIALYPLQMKASQQFLLSMATALACRDLFSNYEVDEMKIKWPNDLYWRDRKAGGILIENIFAGNQWKAAVIGIGININQVIFDAALKNPVSLRQITGKEENILNPAKELHRLVLKRFDEIDKRPPSDLLNEYNSHLFALNKTVRLKKENMIFETMIKGVNEKGQLITMDATERTWEFGELSWVF